METLLAVGYPAAFAIGVLIGVCRIIWRRRTA